ncbi:MAG: hypothetical protein AAGG38_06190 [Planctomycetota bacterium]
MVRTNQRGLELSFHRASKRWRKRLTVDGKPTDMYFGRGTGVSDRKSYRAALTKYREWDAERQRQADVKDAFDTVVDELLSGMATSDPDEVAVMLGMKPEPKNQREQQLERFYSHPG